MEVKVITGDIASVEADAIVVNLFEGVENPGGATAAVDKALDGAITKLIEQGEIKGKLNEISIIHSLGKVPARIVAVAGLGKQSDFTLDKIRDGILPRLWIMLISFSFPLSSPCSMSLVIAPSRALSTAPVAPTGRLTPSKRLTTMASALTVVISPVTIFTSNFASSVFKSLLNFELFAVSRT